MITNRKQTVYSLEVDYIQSVFNSYTVYIQTIYRLEMGCQTVLHTTYIITLQSKDLPKLAV